MSHPDKNHHTIEPSKTSLANYHTIEPIKWRNGAKQARRNKDAFMPSSCARMFFIGSSESGKTTTLLNAIMKGWLEFDKLYVYSKSLEQDIFRELADFVSEVAEENSIDKTDLCLMQSSLDHAVSLDEIDPDERPVIILDDVLADRNLRSGTIDDMFWRGRHKGAIVCELGQSFFAVPKEHRTNGTHYALFDGAVQGDSDMVALWRAVSGDLKFENFKNLYFGITQMPSADGKRHEFLFVDKQTSDPRLRYRWGFDQLLNHDQLVGFGLTHK